MKAKIIFNKSVITVNGDKGDNLKILSPVFVTGKNGITKPKKCHRVTKVTKILLIDYLEEAF